MGFFSDIGSALVGGVFGLAGSAKEAASAKKAADNANLFTKEQLQNRHQWQVADLRKAGLNPVLSAGGTPSIGGSAQAQVPDYGGNMSRGVSSGLDVARVKAEIDNIKQDTAVKKQTEALVNDQQQKTIWDTLLTQMTTEGIRADNVLKLLDADIYGSNTGKALRYGEKGGGIIKDFGIGVGSSAGGIANTMRKPTTVNNTYNNTQKVWKDSPALKMKGNKR